MRKITYLDANGNEVIERTRLTAGRRRCAKLREDGTPRFRGPGRGKKDYPEGRNPTRTANGGRAD